MTEDLHQLPTPALPPFPDPEVSRRRFEDEVVGPDGETRAEVRLMMLEHLAELTSEVKEAQDAGRIEELEAFRLRLRIHNQRCQLVGLPWSGGDPW